MTFTVSLYSAHTRHSMTHAGGTTRAPNQYYKIQHTDINRTHGGFTLPPRINFLYPSSLCPIAHWILLTAWRIRSRRHELSGFLAFLRTRLGSFARDLWKLAGPSPDGGPALQLMLLILTVCINCVELTGKLKLRCAEGSPELFPWRVYLKSYLKRGALLETCCWLYCCEENTFFFIKTGTIHRHQGI